MPKSAARLLGAVALGLACTAVTAEDAKPDRFDHVVREDIFAGFNGDKERRDRGLKACEEALAKNPKNAEAMVWHGAALMQVAVEHFQKGDQKTGVGVWLKAIGEMDAAVKLAPDSYGVRIPRGAVYVNAGRNVPNEGQRKALLGKAREDLEYMLGKHTDDLEEISAHRRGELLMGLAELARRAGDEKKATEYLERVVKTDKANKYGERAAAWLKDPKQMTHTCIGCHKE